MTKKIEALKMALEALDQLTNVADTFSVSGVYLNEEVWAKKCLSDAYFAITTIEEALAVDKESLTTEARHMPSNDALYKAWNLIGADLAGLKFEDFAKNLLAQQSNEQGCEHCNHSLYCGTKCKNCGKQSNEQVEPVAWRYKPVRENNPRWEYTTEHPLDMGDGYLRPSLVEYCKCIEPLYAKEKPKLMLEKFREMKDLLNDTHPPVPTAQPDRK